MLKGELPRIFVLGVCASSKEQREDAFFAFVKRDLIPDDLLSLL